MASAFDGVRRLELVPGWGASRRERQRGLERRAEMCACVRGQQKTPVAGRAHDRAQLEVEAPNRRSLPIQAAAYARLTALKR